MAVFTKLLKEDIENFISEYSIGNLDSDDELEVVFGAYTNSGKIFAINFDGTDVDGFPFELSEKMLGIALADFDDNGIDDNSNGGENYEDDDADQE